MNPKSLNFALPQSTRQTLTVFGVLAFGPWICVSQAQSSDEMLRAVRLAEKQAQFAATQTIRRGKTQEVVKIFRSGPKRRLEWISPADKAGDVLVDDGEKVWLYHRVENTAIQTRSSPRAAGLGAAEWKIGPPFRQDGRLVRVLSRPNGRQLTLDENSKIVLRSQSGRSVMALQNVEMGTVAASKFVFSPPPGTKISRFDGTLYNNLEQAKRRASWFKIPSELPPGYTFQSAVVGNDEVWLRYSDSRRTFSLFQQKTDAGTVAPTPVEGGWFWKQNGLRFLATDAPENSVQTLSSSLK